MTEDELDLVKQFALNKKQFDAVKKFLLDPLDPQNWLSQLDIQKDDDWYGQQAKMRVEAKNTLLAQFEEMERMIDEKKPKQSINEAR